MQFIFGADAIIPSFEAHLEGLQAGDKFKFTLIPADAYGNYNEEHLMELPKSSFTVDGRFQSEQVQEGRIIRMSDDDGNLLNGSVMEVKEETVLIDFNHPLAGETLHFSGEVIDVHVPTQWEIDMLASEYGHPEGGCEGGCDTCKDCE
jgi:FKBP-type peptidyl-prolyl cis-trans isomerase SlyD